MPLDKPRWYILVGRTPVACGDLITWGQWLATADRHVIDTDIDGIRVSTVFLGMDHSWDNGDPVLFETMIFGGALDGEQWRYCTWDQAEQGHLKACNAVRKAQAQIDQLAKTSGATN